MSGQSTCADCQRPMERGWEAEGTGSANAGQTKIICDDCFTAAVGPCGFFITATDANGTYRLSEGAPFSVLIAATMAASKLLQDDPSLTATHVHIATDIEGQRYEARLCTMNRSGEVPFPDIVLQPAGQGAAVPTQH